MDKIITFKKLDKKLIHSTTNERGNSRECWHLKIQHLSYKVTLTCLVFERKDLPSEKILFVDFIPLRSDAVYENNVRYLARKVISAVVRMITNCVIRFQANIVTFHVLRNRESLVKIYQRYAKTYGRPVECPEIINFVHERNPYKNEESTREFSFYVR